MSRTTRKNLSDRNWNEARGMMNDPRINRSRHRGGLTMSEAVCGIYKDDRYQSSAARDMQRRAVKRSERQAWKKAHA